MRLADAKAIADAGKKGKYSVPELETALHRLRHAQGHLPRAKQKAWKRSEGRIAGLERELATRRDAGSHRGHHGENETTDHGGSYHAPAGSVL